MSTIVSLKFTLEQVTIYLGLLILIPGLIGGTLNIVVFTTLNTFRKTTCGFYLAFASVTGVGQMMTSLFVRILSNGFHVDPRKISWFCKIYYFLSNWCYIVWLSTICLATIAQFLSVNKYRHFSYLRFGGCSIIITSIFWFIHNIFLLIYWDASTGVCTVISPHYSLYYYHLTIPVLYGCLPIGVMTTFSLLTFYKARILASRQMTTVRLSHDRQLTAMLLVYVIYTVIVEHVAQFDHHMQYFS